MTTATKTKTETFEAILAEIVEASFTGLAKANPRPMIVGHPSTPFGTDVDPNQQTWYEAGGVCGNAHIILMPANGAFAKWLMQKDLASKSYGGGTWIHSWARKGFASGGQSYERNLQIAYAMADVLTRHGIKHRIHAYID
jgi:hypothetical protein